MGACVAFFDNNYAYKATAAVLSGGGGFTNPANWYDRRLALTGKYARVGGSGGVSIRLTTGPTVMRPTQVVSLLNVTATNINSITCQLVRGDGLLLASQTRSVIPAGGDGPHGLNNEVHFLFDQPWWGADVRLSWTPIGGGSNSLEIGYWWFGPCLYNPLGVDNGWQVAVQDYARVTRLPTGPTIKDEREYHRQLQVTLSNLTEAQAWGAAEARVGNTGTAEWSSAWDVGRFAGQTAPVLILPNTADENIGGASGLFGFLTSPVVIRHEGADRYRATFQMLEGR